jgi:methylated-DNA-[protein]-cysteine S-methyltransferase
MSRPGYALFPTAIGPCAIVWGAAGILGVLLPERDEARTRERVARRWPEAVEAAPPAAVEDVIARIVALLAGEKVEFRERGPRSLGRPGLQPARLRGRSRHPARAKP